VLDGFKHANAITDSKIVGDLSHSLGMLGEPTAQDEIRSVHSCDSLNQQLATFLGGNATSVSNYKGILGNLAT
jgi:hypothetical protein